MPRLCAHISTLQDSLVPWQRLEPLKLIFCLKLHRAPLYYAHLLDVSYKVNKAQIQNPSYGLDYSLLFDR